MLPCAVDLVNHRASNYSVCLYTLHFTGDVFVGGSYIRYLQLYAKFCELFFPKGMAHVPRSFEEAFRRIRAELVDHVFVSWRLLNQLLQEGLLTQRHLDELKVLCILHNSVAGVLLNGFDFGNHSQHGSAELL